MFKIIIIIILLSFPIFADDIKDFEIEGMSVGKSLLNYMSEKNIKKNIGYVYPDKQYTTSLFSGFVGNYDEIAFQFKTTDNNYFIDGIFGFIKFPNNINDCYNKQDEIINDLKKIFDENSFKDWGVLVYDNNDSSTYRPITYEFDSGHAVQVSCTNYPKNPDQHNLKVSIMMKEYKEYLYNDAVDVN